MRDPDHKVSVLYIAGWGRSGSTLLDRLVGRDPHFHSGGEIVWTWDKGVLNNRQCSCGALFAQCPFWASVRALDVHLQDRSRAEMNKKFLARLERGRWAILFSSAGRRFVYKRIPDWYRDEISDLYRAIETTSKAEVIVDSSKRPAYLYLLGQVPSIDLRVVHVVRDPRGVVNSWRRPPTPDPDGRGGLVHYGAPMSIGLWSLSNLLSSRIASELGVPYLLVRYEDLVSDPTGVVEEVKEFATASRHGGDGRNSAGRTPKTFVLGPDHLLGGNPMRFHQGSTDVRIDEEWRTKLGPVQQRLIGLSVLPMLRSYGYKLAPGRTPARLTRPPASEQPAEGDSVTEQPAQRSGGRQE